MYLTIAADAVTLHQPEVVTDFYASYSQRLTQERLGQVLEEQEVGTLQPNGAHVMVRVDALRRMAEGRVAEGWEDDFQGMLTFAREKGWLSEDGESVRAHLERER